MSSSSRKAFVGGNWKCNGTVASVGKLIEELNAGAVPDSVECVVAPISIHVSKTAAELKSMGVAAQNCSRTGDGAFTGEVSASQLKDFGIKYVILGHSERRAYYGETPDVVAEKVAIAQAEGLTAIICIGETLDDRKADKTMDVCISQLKPMADKVKDWSRIVLAYEPVWAIGTGVTATPAQAQEVHAKLRDWLTKNVSDKVANELRIIYGGSVKPSNCDELWALPDVDGFLVGGASLKGSDFLNICGAPARAK